MYMGIQYFLRDSYLHFGMFCKMGTHVHLLCMGKVPMLLYVYTLYSEWALFVWLAS